MKYTVNLSFRGRGISLMKLTEEEKDTLLDVDDLDEIYIDWVERKDYDFDLEEHFLTYDTDRFTLTVRDESGEVVYETDDIDDIMERRVELLFDRYPEGREWKGMPAGYYLARISTVPGCEYTGTLEIDGEFNPDRFYVDTSDKLNDSLTGEDLVSPYAMYYMKSDDPEEQNMKTDCHLKMEMEGDMGEQYWDTYVMELKDNGEWENL